MTRLYTALKLLPLPSGEGWGGGVPDWTTPHSIRFKSAMDDDLNTPEAVAVLFDLANELNRNQSAEIALQLKALAGVLGLLQRDPQEFLQGEASEGGLDDTAISAQIDARIAAKKAKNFAEADRIRKELIDAGIMLEDTAQGTTWRRA